LDSRSAKDGVSMTEFSGLAVAVVQ